MLALIAWVPAVVTLHEVGHALAARPAGFRVTSFGVGRGRVLARHQLRGGVVLYVALNLVAGGACVAIPREAEPGPRSALFHAGGGLAQLAIAGLLALLPQGAMVESMASFNLLVLAVNLLPWRALGTASDGWWILQHLRPAKARAGSLLGRRAELGRIESFEARVGSRVGVWYAQLMRTWLDLQVGRAAAADPFFREEHAEATVDPELEALQHYIEACWHRQRGRPLAALHLVRRLREGGAELAPRALDLLALVEARSLMDLGAIEQAQRALAAVAGVGGPVGQEALVVRLEIATVTREAHALRPALRRVIDELDRPGLDPVAPVVALGAAAAVLAMEGAAEEARAVAAVVARAARQLSEQVEAEDAASLAARLSGRASEVATGEA